MRLFNCFVRDKNGATAIEYGLIASIMAIALLAGFPRISQGVEASVDIIAGAFSQAMQAH